MPLTMAASVVLDQLPKDAHQALQTAGELEMAKGGRFSRQRPPVSDWSVIGCGPPANVMAK